jgi:hypothetical protein
VGIVELREREQEVSPFIAESDLMQVAQCFGGVALETIAEVEPLKHQLGSTAAVLAIKGTGIGVLKSLPKRYLPCGNRVGASSDQQEGCTGQQEH